ncbi:MAG: PD40 domain-containing protein [Gemmatimonadaceae bacterium]|nr:PD40 domain-containing protein [Gemmatimonadaceae bacterium]
MTEPIEPSPCRQGRRGGALARVLCAALLAVGLARPGAARAQGAPNAHWRTIRTPHFAVHFTPPLEDAARRAAASAESAYVQLAVRLHPPRGPIDLVIADNVDFANGFTNPFPSNRIVVYAHPPLDVPALRYYDDWLSIVITHELTHVFHLDRTRGWWHTAQQVFGRAPFLFPNLYEPAWITEGLAVYYESDITGAGRVAGTHERMLLDAEVRHGGVPPFDAWNLSSSRYPGGDMAYGYGSLFLDYIARTYGRDKLRDFVEQTSRTTLPFRLDRAASRAFGVSFHQAWRDWRRELAASPPPDRLPLDGWRDLSRGGHVAIYPRWLDSTSLVYSGYTWRETPAAYRVTLDGAVRRLGRRNGPDANAVLPDGSLLFSQIDFTSPYDVRSDLYVERNGHEIRLTHGARLAEADARRSDGAIIAVRFVPASTQLVRVSADGRTITPLTAPSIDTAWAEPRWSPRGDRIVATRWTRGGYADVVILDTLGAVVREITHDRAVDSTPSWSPDGTAVLFTSDRTGVADVYIAPADSDGEPRRVSRASLGVFYPTLSPDGTRLAASRYDVAGWHVGVAPFDTAGADTPPVSAAFDPRPMPAPVRDTSAAHDYSPWRMLVPRYWLPIVGQTASGGYEVGAFTSGFDIIGRHSYFAQALLDPRDGEHTFDVTYRYAGLAQPVLDVGANQAWERTVIVDRDRNPLGDLLRRARVVSLGATVSRPRLRTNAFASIAGELEMRHYLTDPDTLLGKLDPYYRSDPTYWSLIGTVGWSNAQRAPLSISAEDGISFAASGRIKWLEGTPGVQSRSIAAALSAYKSIDAGSYAHHVVAARVAAGFASGADPGEYDLGGSSGTPVVLFPGATIGSHHTFAVRGFPSGAQSGTSIATGTLEYRLPISTPRRGFGFWPAFLDRTSVALFADAGAAWGGVGSSTTPAPGTQRTADHWLSSLGAELDLDTGFEYDLLYRLRLGFAVPVAKYAARPPDPVSVYFQLGFAF